MKAGKGGDHLINGWSEAATRPMPVVGTSAEPVSPGGYVRYGPGEAIARPRPGDIILVRGVGFLGWGIRAYERMCARGKDRAFVHWSHAAVVVSPRGHLVEVMHNGVALAMIEKYRNQEYHYVRIELSDPDRDTVARYALSCVRQKYARWTFVHLAASKMLGGRLRVPDRGQQGCISLIVRALQQVGVPFDRAATDMSVVDVAKRFGVRP
jgi:hypothetical protein